MISTADFRNGMTIEYEGNLYSIIEFQHHKPGKGGAVVRTKLKDLHSGATINKTFRSGEKMEQAVIERKKKQFLYRTDSTYYFMDMETYEQIPLDISILGENIKFLKEDLEIQVLIWNDKMIGVELPTFIDYKVTYTEPGLRGDTVSGTNKPATIETGAVVQVPLFIEIGTVIKVDTRTGQYIQRV